MGTKTCPHCNDANSCGDYEGPTCEVCDGKGVIHDDDMTRRELQQIQKRAATFITDRDPFGDHFSAHDLAMLDPAGGYIEI